MGQKRLMDSLSLKNYVIPIIIKVNHKGIFVLLHLWFLAVFETLNSASASVHTPRFIIALTEPLVIGYPMYAFYKAVVPKLGLNYPRG